jgi:hypothetical protein
MVQDLLCERQGAASRSATRELDDLAEAVLLAGHPWAGQDLIDLATVSLAAMHHSALPGLRSAAFAYMDQLAAKPSSLSRAGSIPADIAPGMPSWLTPATGLAQNAGIDCCGLADSLAQLESTLANSPALEPRAQDLLNARALELATAASRVIRARCEGDLRAEDRLRTVATRRLGELAEVTRIASGWGTARSMPTSRETTVSTEQMRTALIDEHFTRLERRRCQQARITAARATSRVDTASEQPAPTPIPPSVEAAMEDRA